MKDYQPIDNTYSSAFKFMHWINEKGQDIVQKTSSIVPLSSLIPVYIRKDNTGLKMFNNSKEMPFLNLFNEKAEKICKNKEIGRGLKLMVRKRIKNAKIKGIDRKNR